MADKKISELPTITGANLSATDLIPIVDVSSNATSKVTRSEFFKNITGNVGIGTATPGSKLDVNGDVYLTADTTETRSIKIGRGRTGDGFSFVDLISDNTYTDFGARFIRNPGTDGVTTLRTRGTGALNLITQEAANIVMATSDVERMRITSDGNVGIGTSSPTNLLDVNADSVRVRTSQTPATSSASGNQGEIAWDANYIYVCTATNTWKRVAISTW